MSCGTTHYKGCECNEEAHAREIAALQANTDASQRRVLELELEVKRLRDGIESIAGSQPVQELNRGTARFAMSLLRTPPARLAEAYVRLRDAVKLSMSEFPAGYFAIGAASPGEKLEIEALSEIERLEKGE